MSTCTVPFWYLRDEDPYSKFSKCVAAVIQERPLLKKYFFNLNFAAIIQERPLFESDHYWRGYGTYFKDI